MIISDEYGREVVTVKDSPSNKAILRLKALGYDWIVLPRRLHLGLTPDPECGIMPSFRRGVMVGPEVIPKLLQSLPVESQWKYLGQRLEECLSDSD